MSQSLVTRLSSHVFTVTSALGGDSFGTVSELWVHVPTLSCAVSFPLFRVLKGLQDSRVRRYVCLKVSLLGVMVLRLREPNLTLFTSKGDPGVGAQGPPGPIGPPGPKVSRCPIPRGGGSGQVGGRGHSGGRGPSGTTPPFAVRVPGRLGPFWPLRCSWYRRLPRPARPSGRDGSARPQRRAGKGAGGGVRRLGGSGASEAASGRGEDGPGPASGLQVSGGRGGRRLPSHLCLSCLVFLAGSGRPPRARGSPGPPGATWTTRVSGE